MGKKAFNNWMVNHCTQIREQKVKESEQKKLQAKER